MLLKYIMSGFDGYKEKVVKKEDVMIQVGEYMMPYWVSLVEKTVSG